MYMCLMIDVVNIRMWIRKTIESEGGDYFVTRYLYNKNIDNNENIKHCTGLNHMVLVGY